MLAARPARGFGHAACRGTFQPIHNDIIENVHLHSESFVVPPETVRAMDAASA